jgi:hypothetical protein
LASLVTEGQQRTGHIGGKRGFYSQRIDRQAARGDALVAIEAGIGRSSGINHSEIGLELEDRIIPGLNLRVNNTRMKIDGRAM